MFRKAGQSCAPQSGSPKLLSKAVPQSTSAKRLPQSCYASNLFPKAAPQSYSPKRLLKAAPQSCYRKLPPKVASQRSLIPKAAPQSCGFQSCCSKLPRKAAPQSCSCFPSLLPEAAPQSCSPKPLPKVVIESCSEQLLPKAAKALPKLLSKATPQSCRFSKQLFVNAAAKPQSSSPQLFPKAALQSCYRKPRPKEAPQNSKVVPRSCLKAGPESGLVHEETQKRARFVAR